MTFDTPLCEIAYKYGVDRCPQIAHPYTPFYYEMLKDKRESFKKVVEFGIGNKIRMSHNPPHYRTGGGLYMWREFFPNAQIYGIDNDPAAMFEDERIKTFLLDERIPEHVDAIVEKTGPDVDLFIDDAIHHHYHQVVTCRSLMPKLKKEVIYLIEDVVHPNHVKQRLRRYNCEVIEATYRRRNYFVTVRNYDV